MNFGYKQTVGADNWQIYLHFIISAMERQVAVVIAQAKSWSSACIDCMVMWCTKQLKELRRSRNWPQVGPAGPEESLRWSLAFRFWSFYALLWCIMSDLWSCRVG